MKLCKEYALKSNAIYHTYEKDNKKYVYQLIYNNTKIEFCYFIKATSLILPHTLFCRIYLSKNSVVYYHLPDIISALDTKDFRCCYFSFIESPERMEACFWQLCKILNTYVSDIDSIALREEEIREKLFETYIKIYRLKEGSINWAMIDNTDLYDHIYFCSLQKHRDEFLVGQFTTLEGYRLFLDGDFKSAEKRYEKANKKGNLLLYEKQLLEFISKPENARFVPISEECFSLKYGVEEITALDLVKIFGIVFIGFSIFFCALFAIVNAILSQGAEFFFAAPWYLGVLPGGLCTLFGGMAFYKSIIRLFTKARKDRNAEIEAMANSKWVEIFAKTVFAIALAFSIFASVMMLASYAKFDKDTFSYPSSDNMISINHNTYSYDEIYGVYYINSRYNIYGDRIDRPSYVIVLNDGNTFDLDGSTSVKKSEKTVIPFLAEKGFEVTILNSDRDLPFQNK